MNRRGRSSHGAPHSPFVSDGNSAPGQRGKVSQTHRQSSWQRKSDSYVKDIPVDMGSPNLVQNSPASVVHNSKQVDNTSTLSSNDELASSGPSNEQPYPRESVTDTAHSPKDNDVSLLEGDNSAIRETPSNKEIESSQTSKQKSFDICQETSGSKKLKPSLFHINKEKRKESNRTAEGFKGSVLKPGMVLLKNYISCEEQVEIVKKCRELGLGIGGFYQPGYRDGAELHLKMMCLGKNWDPETGRYGELRPFDQAKPPDIPCKFSQLVKRVIQDSHEFLQKHCKERNVEKVLPSMSADLCIVNFYAKSGRLGFHRDKDESKRSLDRELPVVSISIGDKAEFLYSDHIDVERAEKVELESGDVLVFGGKSRHIYHGVKKIIENSAPKALLEESKLRPGRLNLTFREY